MTTKASNSVLNLTDPPIDAAKITDLAIEGVASHSVIIGKGTSFVVGAAPGTTGRVLTSNGPSADPTFQPVPPPSIDPVIVSQLVGPGQFIRLDASVSSPSPTVTFTADQVMVTVALDGHSYLLAGVNSTLNIASIGAGGMDTGAAPASGFLSIYLIYDPDTVAIALLATTSAQTSIYTGGNMPAGYTASGLIAIWPTSNTGLLQPAQVIDRDFFYALTVAEIAILVNVLFEGNATSPTPVSLASIVPAAARSLRGGFLAQETNAITGNSIAFFSPINADDRQVAVEPVNVGGFAQIQNNLPLVVPQTIYYFVGQSTANASLNVLGYGL